MSEDRKNKRRSTILDKLAADAAEKSNRKAIQDAKDKEFLEQLREIEASSTKSLYNVEDTKQNLKEDTEKRTLRRVQEIQNFRRKFDIEANTSSEETAFRICETFRTFELNATAHELDQFCVNCGCVHTMDVVNE